MAVLNMMELSNHTTYNGPNCSITSVPFYNNLCNVTRAKFTLSVPLYLTFASISSFLTISTNGMTLVLFLRDSDLQTPSNLLVGSLSFADAVSFLLGPLDFIEELHTTNIWFCSLKASFQYLLLNVNVCIISLIAIDRYVYIVHALKYHVFVTVGRLAGSVSVIWFLALGYSLLVFFLEFEHLQSLSATDRCSRVDLFSANIRFVMLIWVGVNLLVTVVLYLRIGKVALDQARRLVPLYPQRIPPTPDFKFAKVMVMVLFVYLGCNLTLVIMFGLARSMSPAVQDLLNKIAHLIWRANTWLNPFIYFWKSLKFREAFKKYFI